MYEIKRGSRFRKSYKKLAKSGRFDVAKFEKIVSLLFQGDDLPADCHDHALKGDFAGMRECHIGWDCLLVYMIYPEEKVIRLLDMGSHANTFH